MSQITNQIINQILKHKSLEAQIKSNHKSFLLNLHFLKLFNLYNLILQKTQLYSAYIQNFKQSISHC